jgi:hypothetical protein
VHPTIDEHRGDAAVKILQGQASGVQRVMASETNSSMPSQSPQNELDVILRIEGAGEIESFEKRSTVATLFFCSFPLSWANYPTGRV